MSSTAGRYPPQRRGVEEGADQSHLRSTTAVPRTEMDLEMEGEPVDHPIHPQGRRSSIRSALQGLQRFKQSWISVMVLKGGIGLGQVIVLITLLILASTLPSPLYPNLKQSQPSEACPRPHLSQAWMGVQAVRLSLCWLNSIWVCVRLRRSQRGVDDVEQREDDRPRGAGLSSPQRNVQAPPVNRPHTPPSLSHSTYSLSSTVFQTPSSNLSHERSKQPGQERQNHFAATHGPQCEDGHTIESDPDQTPDTIYISTFTSTPDLSVASPDQISGRHVSQHAIQLRDQSKSSPRGGQHTLEWDDRPYSSPIRESQGEGIGECAETLHVRVERVSRADTDGAREDDRSSMRAARRMVGIRRSRSASRQGHRQNQSVSEEEAETHSWANLMDKIAPRISKFLALSSFVLFILGNILLFDPPPSAQLSCYKASPMLWWGVMTVTGVGWFLIAQVVLIVLVVGVGGHIVLAILRRIGLVAPAPEPQPARPARPSPLTEADLSKLQYVVYVPAASAGVYPNLQSRTAVDITSTDDEPTTTTTKQTSEVAIEEGNYPYPTVRLDEDQATCAICQENYVPATLGAGLETRPGPGGGRGIELLRRLDCGHVYHAKCIDEWLLRGAANCPFCNRSVREMIERHTSPTDVTDQAGRRSGRFSIHRLRPRSG